MRTERILIEDDDLAESGIDMNQNITQKAWHDVVGLRPEVLSGELTMNEFAADLLDVATGNGRPLYKDVSEFFSFTYPTQRVKNLARDVIGRLAGQNDKAVHQLTLTYGGGKTHTMITLYHLVNDPVHLPRHLQAVDEFLTHIQVEPPKARVAVLAFDKIDIVAGLDVLGPSGAARHLHYPWSVLAYQLADEEGLRILYPTGQVSEGQQAERDTPPAEKVLVDLFAAARQQMPAVLLLMDEVMMFARMQIAADSRWREYLNFFFQCLTQAVEKVPGCALVTSLLAAQPKMNDEIGRGLLSEFSSIFRRKQEETVEPVGKEDIAEVMRRRFFTVTSLQDRTLFAEQASAALRSIAELDEQTQRDFFAQEKRFIQSYPFHPDLTDLF